MTHRSLSLVLTALLSLVPLARAEDAKAPIDLLAFSNGGLFERASSTYGGAWIGLWLLDEEPATGWANEEGAKPPFELVVSVPERSRFDRFVFDTSATESPERSVQDVAILVSDESATAGFKPLMSVKLAAAQDGPGFDVPSPALGRWVKLVVKTNHGDDKYWEIMNVHGFGADVGVGHVRERGLRQVPFVADGRAAHRLLRVQGGSHPGRFGSPPHAAHLVGERRGRQRPRGHGADPRTERGSKGYGSWMATAGGTTTGC